MRFFPSSMSTTAKTALGLSAAAALGAGLVMGGQISNPSAFSSLSWDGVKATLGGIASSAIDVATSARNSAMVSSIVGPQSGLVHLGLPMGSREPWAFCSPDTDFQREQDRWVTDVSVNNPKSFSFLTMDPKRTNLFRKQECFLSQVPQTGRYSLSEESFVSAPNPSASSWLSWCSTGCNFAVTREDIESATSGGYYDKVKSIAKMFSSEPATGQISCSEPMSIGKIQLQRSLDSDSCATMVSHGR